MRTVDWEIASQIAEKLLQRGTGARSIRKILVKGEFKAIKLSFYKRFSARTSSWCDHEISSWKQPVSMEQRVPHSPLLTPFKACQRSAAAAAHGSISAEASNSFNRPPLQDRLVTVLISQPSGCEAGGRNTGGTGAGVHQPGLVSFPHTSCFLRSLSGTAAGHHYTKLAAILRPAVATGQTAVLETFLILSHL